MANTFVRALKLSVFAIFCVSAIYRGGAQIGFALAAIYDSLTATPVGAWVVMFPSSSS
jgi:hypothetical protein